MPAAKSKPKSQKSTTSRPKSTRSHSRPVRAKVSALNMKGDCYTNTVEWHRLLLILMLALCLAVIWGSVNYYNYMSAKAQYDAFAGK